jgi:hypothetical protein
MNRGAARRGSKRGCPFGEVLAAVIDDQRELERGVARDERRQPGDDLPNGDARRERNVRDELARVHDALASLRARYHQVLEELHLLKRRLYVAKAERLDDVADAQLAFDKLTAEAKALEKVIGAAEGADDSSSPAPPPTPLDKERKPPSTKPTGRRNLADCDLPEVRVEIADPELEGKFERIGFDESSRVGYERGGRRRVVCARVVYKNAMKQDVEGESMAEWPSPVSVDIPASASMRRGANHGETEATEVHGRFQGRCGEALRVWWAHDRAGGGGPGPDRNGVA